MNSDINLLLDKLKLVLNIGAESDLARAIQMSAANLRNVRQKEKLTWSARFNLAASIGILPNGISVEDVSLEYISSLLGLDGKRNELFCADARLLLLVREILLEYKLSIDRIGVKEEVFNSVLDGGANLTFENRLSIIEKLYEIDSSRWVFHWSKLSNYCRDSIILASALLNIVGRNDNDSLNDKVLNCYREIFSITSERNLADALHLSISQLGNVRGKRAKIPLNARVKMVSDIQASMGVFQKVDFDSIQMLIKDDFALERKVNELFEAVSKKEAA